MALPELVRKVRRLVGDFPTRTFVATASTGAGVSGDIDTITIAPGSSGMFPLGGVRCEFDDGTDEQVITVGPADRNSDSLQIRRGMDGTTPVDHAVGVPILLEPRFGYAQVTEAAELVVDTEMWPYVWQKGEVTLTPDFATDSYDGPAGIEEVVYAYQVSGGFIYPISAKLMGASVADDVNFPNGNVMIDPGALVDSGSIFLSYRQRATIATITPGSSLEHLAVLGTVAHLMTMEESVNLAPGAGVAERGIQEGSNLRAGAVQWNRFEMARTREMISLTAEEATRRRTYLRGA